MIELLMSMGSSGILALLGGLASTTSVIVELFKKILPQSFPTKALAIIVSLIVTLGFTLLTYGVAVETIVVGILGSFVVSFISMYGWDTFKDIIERF